jgi:hypothetical protein
MGCCPPERKVAYALLCLAPVTRSTKGVRRPFYGQLRRNTDQFEKLSECIGLMSSVEVEPFSRTFGTDRIFIQQSNYEALNERCL